MPFVVAVVALGLLVALAPGYSAMQTAATADEFRLRIADVASGRIIAAALADVVFAAAYAVAAVGVVRRFRLPVWAPVLIVAGAAFDELENVLLIRNVLGADSIGDSSIDWMTTFGVVKTWDIVAGLLVVGVCAIGRWRA